MNSISHDVTLQALAIWRVQAYARWYMATLVVSLALVYDSARRWPSPNVFRHHSNPRRMHRLRQFGLGSMNLPQSRTFQRVLIVYTGIVASASAISTKDPAIARTPRPKSSIAVLSPRLSFRQSPSSFRRWAFCLDAQRFWPVSLGSNGVQLPEG